MQYEVSMNIATMIDLTSAAAAVSTYRGPLTIASQGETTNNREHNRRDNQRREVPPVQLVGE